MLNNTMIKFKSKGRVIRVPVPTESVDKLIKLINEEPSMEFISTFKSNEVPFNELPDSLKKKVIESYHKCTVIFENGEFNIYVGDCIKNEYPVDYFICKTYMNSDIQ